MPILARRSFLGAGLGACACLAAPAVFAQAPAGGKYVCPPCDCNMHDREFDGPGKCPACGMTLIPKPASLPFEPKSLPTGKSAFLTRGGKGREAQRITVHVYRPASFRPTSPVLLVLPGAGRNADQYRDAWIETADAKGVLVFALSYPEADWDFAGYQMASVIRDLQIVGPPQPGSTKESMRLKDEHIKYQVERDPARWLFDDFDRVFALVKAATGSKAKTYDAFGHSAGGQILSRLPLFKPNSGAVRIVAGNAGLYTQPSLQIPAPFGLGDSGRTAADLKAAFACRLTVLLGGEDNDGESGGLQLHTPIADSYGVDRLARGHRFFELAQAEAKASGATFNWTLQTVPGVGHEYRGMTRAAAKLLYG